MAWMGKGGRAHWRQRAVAAMFDVLANPRFRRLFLAQLVALLGTGLATVALGLLAFDLAGDRAAMVLGTVFAIKMIAYVGVAPVAAAFAERVSRRGLLVSLDILRGAIALALPFVTEIWQVYVLIFVLQSASAAFTPTFQATIPDILPDEDDYTKALSLSRLAYEIENLASPTLAALLLAATTYGALFVGTSIGFIASALLIVAVALPSPRPSAPRGVYDRTTRGARIYLATPRLRGLLALNVAAAMVGAMALVNTVVLTRSLLGLGESAVAITMGAFGLGAMTAAMTLPRVLERWPDRPVMLAGASLSVLSLGGFGAFVAVQGLSWALLLATWALIGLGYAAVTTPSGRLLKRSAHAIDRPALFAAQFALSHACWLVAYPLSGWLMTEFGAAPAAITLAVCGFAGILGAASLWPVSDPIAVTHRHEDLAPDHPHLKDGPEHRHRYVIDDLHRSWPS